MKNKWIILLFIASINVQGQSAKKLVLEGNKAYFGLKDYKKAESFYKRALAADSKYGKAGYNLGAAYFKQNKFDEAAAQFEGIKALTKNKDTVAGGLHNQGTSYLKAKRYDEAVKTLKEALKLNPKDEDTRYNLAYALAMKKKEDEKKKKKEQQQQQQQSKPENKKEQKPVEKISEKEAERMLNALKQEEKKLQKNKRKKEDNNSDNFSGKDW
jgi:Ca-activated chloride channel homolog